MATTNQFRIRTRPRLFLGAALLDLVDAFPVQAIAVLVAVAAAALLVLS